MQEFRNEEKNVLVKVEINGECRLQSLTLPIFNNLYIFVLKVYNNNLSAYLLPLISIKQDQTRVIDYRSQFSGMDCDQPKEYSKY